MEARATSEGGDVETAKTLFRGGWTAGIGLLAAVLAAAEPSSVKLEPFDSIELRDGGSVVVRHGPVRQATFRRGSPRYSSAEVSDGRLIITSCARPCPADYDLEVEVATPELAAVAVANGGSIEVRGSFPPQSTLAVAVDQGGAVDVRALAADEVTAAVHSGGWILTRPRRSLLASVADGGVITYWGEPRVQSAFEHGGNVGRGSAADAQRPLTDLKPRPPAPVPAVLPVPAVPAVPAVPPGR
jgi:hypothetical protein